MPALNFKKQFAPAVRDKTKRQTIRATRKRPIRIGNTLYLYTGMRTKSCELLATTSCRLAVPILINRSTHTVYLAGRDLPRKEQVALARNDGFTSLADFYLFFGDDFTGQLIIW